MQVLKFGGTSVANAENIKRVAGIIGSAVLKDKTVVVVSALGGVTDMLLQCGATAAKADPSYKQLLQEITQRHIIAIKDLLPVTTQSSILSQIMQQCNEIEDVCNGVFLLKELSPRTKDKIVSYGELLSSQIIAAYLSCGDTKNAWVDARKLIITDSSFTKANVDFDLTNKNIQTYFVSNIDASHLGGLHQAGALRRGDLYSVDCECYLFTHQCSDPRFSQVAFPSYKAEEVRGLQHS